MASRKARRGSMREESKAKKSAKKQLIIMIISVALMIFSVTQVYYLTRYTLGHDVPQEKLRVYKWIYMLFEGDNATNLEE